MSVVAQVLRRGGMPAGWTVWGNAVVTPGKRVIIGSGIGPFFYVQGVPQGARFQYSNVDIILKLNAVTQQEFELNNPNVAGNYIARVSAVAADKIGKVEKNR